MSSETHDTGESEEDENEADTKTPSKDKKDDENKQVKAHNRQLKKS